LNPDNKRLFIPREEVEARLTLERIALLPVIMPPFEARCPVCGDRGTELHHWAPVAMFGRSEADKWPKDYLCKTHHDDWHRTVTPQLTTDQ